MVSFDKYLVEYRKQMVLGTVKAAYQGLMEYFANLRLYLEKNHPDYFVSAVQPGRMDFTYFYFFPQTLKRKKLKVVIIFFHDTFKIEAWLAGYNKAARAKYLKLFKEHGFKKYRLAPEAQDSDSILEYTLTDNSDFSKPDTLTKQIETTTQKFIQDIENFLSKQEKSV